MQRNRLEIIKIDDRVTVIKILALNGYCTRLVTESVNGKKRTFVEYWEEK